VIVAMPGQLDSQMVRVVFTTAAHVIATGYFSAKNRSLRVEQSQLRRLDKATDLPHDLPEHLAE